MDSIIKKIEKAKNESDLLDVRKEVMSAYNNNIITDNERHSLWGKLAVKSRMLITPKQLSRAY